MNTSEKSNTKHKESNLSTYKKNITVQTNEVYSKNLSGLLFEKNQ